MTNKKNCGGLGFGGGFKAVSLREFAKRKRVNSWQSTENFVVVLGFLAEVLREFLELVA